MPIRQISIQIAISVVSLLIVAVVVWTVPRISSIFSGVFVPKGAIVAFTEESCPEGWEEYRNAKGRFLRGVSESDKIEKLGGTDTVTLEEDHLPRHRHRVHDTDHTATPGHPDDGSMEYGRYYKNRSYTDFAGQEDPTPIDTVPQYVGVLYCQKD